MEVTTLIALTLFILDWVIKLAFIIYIPQKRNPSSAIAWLLALFVIPYLGIILFFIIGSPKLSRSRRNQQKYIDNLVERSSPVKSNQLGTLPKTTVQKVEPIAQLAKSLGKFSAAEGNTVKILPEYDKAIEDIVRQIKTAKKYVHLEYFILTLDDTTRSLFTELEAAINRGVTVRVLIDALGPRSFPYFKETKRELTRIGADWHLMLPIRLTRKKYNRPDLRNHRKILVVDGLFAYIGSQNLIKRNYHRKDDIYYDELVAKITGPAVNACNAIFASDWFAETQENISKKIALTKLSPKSGSSVVQMLPSGPNFEYTNNAKVFTSLIHAAKKEVVITNPYFVPNEAILNAVITAALRGVRVRIINSEAMDQWMVGHAQRSYYQQLLEAGVEIYLYKYPRLLHSKHMTIDDDIAIVGSSNMDIRSFELDLECTMIAYDPAVVKALRKVQMYNIKNATKLNVKTWKKRSLWQNLRDSLARMTAALQ